MAYLYGREWFDDKREPVMPITEEEARLVFDKGPQLGVATVEGVGSVPRYTLTLSARAEDVSVHLYDEHGSEVSVLSYDTQKGRLFLFNVVERLYPDDGRYHGTTGALANRTYYVKPNGYSRLRTRVESAPAATIEEFSGVNVSEHWLDPLQWGDWDRIGEYRPSAV